VAGKLPVIYRGESQVSLDVTSISLILWINEITPADLDAGKFYFGTSKTNLIHSHVADIHVDGYVRLTDVDLSAFLTAGKKYYYQFRPDSGDDCVGADSGIYNFLAA
ncbi:unnamed protein product, partial [marine sediment metagenome]